MKKNYDPIDLKSQEAAKASSAPMDELPDLIHKMKERKPELYRHLVGLIKLMLATA